MSLFCVNDFKFFIAGNIAALKKLWIVGDVFVNNIHHSLQELRTDMQAAHGMELYMYANYSLSTWYKSQLVSVHPSIVRIYNSLIETLNTEPFHLPKYILVIPDVDIIESLKFYDFQARELIHQNLHWLNSNIFKSLTHHRNDLKNKRISSVSDLPTVIYVKMLTRPRTDDETLKCFWTLKGKFNQELESLVLENADLHLMELTQVDEFYHFDALDKLTEHRKTAFWSNVDEQFKLFDHNQIELKPEEHTHYQRIVSHHRNHQNDHQ